MENQLKTELGLELYTASKDGDLNTVTTLSSLERWQGSPNGRPLSAIMAIAADHDRIDVFKYCLSEGGHVSDNVMLHILTSRAFKIYSMLLTTKSVDPDYAIPWHGDVLGNVAAKGDTKWTTLCLENGANPNLNKIDEFKSVLAAAAEAGHIDIAKLLLRNGAWLNGSGALVLASEAGQTEMVRFLLQEGADIDELGVEDETDERETEEMGSALHKAVANGRVDVTRLLVEKGAKIDLKDVQGRTALNLAQERGSREIVQILGS